MSVIDPALTKLHQFYRSVPLPCPYLPGRIERKLFTRINGSDAVALNSVLSRAGFRRSHDILYRPVCAGCSACVPVRIPVARFALRRSLRRVVQANGDLMGTERPAHPSAEQYRLFQRYQQSRHGDSDMARMSNVDYATMIAEGAMSARMVEFRRQDSTLIGAVLIDRLADGLSAVYSFYDPDAAARSLGSFMVLSLVEMARRDGLPHVYLGYWIAGSRKMAYKTRFRPLEALTAEGWQTLDPAAGQDAG